jgi:hypothetical protein
MPVELDVDNGDGRLAPGMFADVVWPVKRALLRCAGAGRCRRTGARAARVEPGRSG